MPWLIEIFLPILGCSGVCSDGLIVPETTSAEERGMLGSRGRELGIQLTKGHLYLPEPSYTWLGAGFTSNVSSLVRLEKGH